MMELPQSPSAEESKDLSTPVKQLPPISNEGVYLGLRLAGELGYMIAVPVVLLGFGGAYMDKHLHTSPLFLFLGMAFAFIISSVSVSKKVKEILATTNDRAKKRSL